jgi:hypothetical protein
MIYPVTVAREASNTDASGGSLRAASANPWPRHAAASRTFSDVSRECLTRAAFVALLAAGALAISTWAVVALEQLQTGAN